ncbi:MAG: cyclic nucleotide-binding domain-containing protein [Spirochaetales bacterium]|nr:cyclic nucleotide-binding domain-containing protein [Spirochaetales bacterium]
MTELEEKALETLASTQMFRYFEKEKILRMVELGDVKVYQKGECIVREGNLSKSLYIIVSGSTDINVSRDEQDVYICTIGEGEVFGEAGIFSSVKRTASVVASDDVILLALDRDRLLEFLKEDNTSGIQLLMVVIYSLLKKLRTANRDLAYERQADITQDDIDSMIRGLLDDGGKE